MIKTFIYILLISLPPLTTLAGNGNGTDTHRDGSHDFDFAIGTWKTHIQRLLHPLTGSKEWTTLDGIVVTRKVWKGRAQLEEIQADGPKGHLEGLNLFLYNPRAHQWSLTWTTSGDGVLGVPTVGEFKDGRAEIYDQESVNGRMIWVRGIWSDIKATTHRFEQAYSDDGGKTWETNFIAEKTFVSHEPAILSAPIDELSGSQRDFDFDIGTWNVHMRRLRHPLTDSSSWYEMNGTKTVSKVWGGKASIAEVEADGPDGHLEILALNLYNPQAHQWAISFASSNAGVLSVPCVGEFHNGVGAFIDQEPYGDRTILVHFKIEPLTADKARSEQAFSNDGGKTWETNWINEYTRVPH